jgi:hypothetical protein
MPPQASLPATGVPSGSVTVYVGVVDPVGVQVPSLVMPANQNPTSASTMYKFYP